MPAGNIQRLEIVVVRLDFRSLRELKTQATQDLDAFFDCLRDRVQCAHAGRTARQCDVDPLPFQCTRQLSLADLALAAGECLLQVTLDDVGGAADDLAFIRAEFAAWFG